MSLTFSLPAPPTVFPPLSAHSTFGTLSAPDCRLAQDLAGLQLEARWLVTHQGAPEQGRGADRGGTGDKE